VSDDELFAEALGLKDLARAGWLRCGVEHPESVAAHSWGIAVLALLKTPAHLDRDRVVRIALVHDLAEARTGDITPHDGVSREEKMARESAAARSMFADHAEFMALWLEYAANETEEAKFVHRLDKEDRWAQAHRYLAAGHAVQELLSDRPRD
jgi:putative hydrolase of HD superfamily